MLLIGRWLAKREAGAQTPRAVTRVLWWRFGDRLLFLVGAAWLLLALLEIVRGMTAVA